ncbi:hypothetical protein DQ04_04231020 [Trypanosoma grayi]|uniref:hypothetical protein n=1 Tax=Trypanosoma grayi TaxID=71804 RepID=UPI0004F4AAF5|nr:hypothetical protein DQ04_04231020 [Trypanosoma grayi]KEG10064.1 hypothetical protein DQ04_04231020 [Trypanosoma grayi]
MVDAVPLSFEEKMLRLLRHRAEQHQLPLGYMRCPLNPAHQVPVAAIVTHLEKTHQQDALALAPGAMYGRNTYDRRREFLREQLHCSDGGGGDRGGSAAAAAANGRRRRHRSRQRRHHHHHNHHCDSSRSSYESDGSYCSSSRDSSCRGRHKPSRQRRRHETDKTRTDAPHTKGGSVTPVLCGTGMLPTAEATTVLIGRCALGYSIARKPFMQYLQQFGPLLRCDMQVKTATFTVVYETVEAASRCLAASFPCVIIDGVTVELHPAAPRAAASMATLPDVHVAGNVMPPARPTYGCTEHVPQPPPPPPLPPSPPPLPPPMIPQQQQQPPQRRQLELQAPSVITVGGKPVGVAMPGDSCAGNILPDRSSTMNPPKCVFIAKLNKGNKENVDERYVWEELSRFGVVKNINVVGPRLIVEYASQGSVDTLTRALQKGTTLSSYCSPLGREEETKGLSSV